MLSTQNIQEYKKVKLENGNMYLNDKRIGLEVFSQGKNIFISDHSFNLPHNIDLSGYLMSENKIQIGEHTYLDGVNNIIYGDLTISGDLTCLGFDAPNQVFASNSIESIFVKVITANSLIINVPIINFSQTLQLNDISMINLITYNTSCKKMDISNNLNLNNLTLYSQENIDISFNFNLNDDLTINGDVSMNNLNILNNLVLDTSNSILIIDQSLNVMENGCFP